jgi:glutathione S-transferase
MDAARAAMIAASGASSTTPAVHADLEARTMIKIHHIEGRRSERIAWVLEELEQPYEVVFRGGDVAGSFADLAKQHPMHMAPTIEDDGATLIESGAIVDYLLRRYGEGRLAPAMTSPDYQRYVQYIHFAEGSAMPRVVPHVIAMMRGKSPPEGRDRDQLLNLMRYLDAELAERPYFAGDAFSAADIMMEFPLKLVARLPDGLNASPHVRAHLDRIYARPAYKRMIAAALPNGPPPV